MNVSVTVTVSDDVGDFASAANHYCNEKSRKRCVRVVEHAIHQEQ